ncbi:GIY-YIG nuclease family protein [Citrobacter braakii]|uniref:GIY-YIG nuclease family protein n=1 Tax=Citrobacter braakii TaxID=57706 RepID=UPI0034E3F809
MARRKKDDNATGIILVILGVIAWGIYVAVRALINLNEQFIEYVSNPAGIIGLFFGLLIAVALIIRVFIYRGFRKKTAELEQAASDLAQKEKAFDETVSTEVARGLYQEKKQLSGQWDDFHNARNKASRALQRIVDSAYKFKVKTLLSGTTVNNWQSKYDQLRKERDAYAAISEKITFLELEDNADWESVKQQFLDKVALLEKAQEEKEYQAELKRQMREEKQRQDELEQQQREAEEEEQRLAEQQRLLGEALLAAEGAHREDEKTLHDHLESYRINRINLRKEFFRVELSRIIDEVERHHGLVEYIADPVALQYLQSLKYAESEAA